MVLNYHLIIHLVENHHIIMDGIGGRELYQQEYGKMSKLNVIMILILMY